MERPRQIHDARTLFHIDKTDLRRGLQKHQTVARLLHQSDLQNCPDLPQGRTGLFRGVRPHYNIFVSLTGEI